MLINCPSCRAEYEVDAEALPESGRRVRCAACSHVWLAYRSDAFERNVAVADDWSASVALPDPPVVEGRAIAASTAPPDGDHAPETARAMTVSEPETPPMTADAAEAAIVDEPSAEPAPRPAPRRAKRKPKPRPPFWTVRKIAVAAVLVLVAMFCGAIHFRNAIARLIPGTAIAYAAIGLPVNLRGVAIEKVVSRMLDDGGASLLVVEGELVNLTNERITLPRLRFAVRSDKGAELFSWTAPADRAAINPGERMTFRRRLASPPPEGSDILVRFVNRSDALTGLN
jgi:predicted Zn finger-like uncharacterized protein